MTGQINLEGDRAIIEENGELSIYAIGDVEKKADESWGSVNGASPSGTLNVGEIGAEVGHLEELSVGGNGPVTGITGDSGEYEVYPITQIVSNDAVTSQDWSFWTTFRNSPVINPQLFDKTGISTYYLAYTANFGREDSDDTATTYVRLRNSPGSETSITGITSTNSIATSSLVPVSDTPVNMSTVSRYPLVQYKTDKGEGKAQNITLYLIGEIA